MLVNEFDLFIRYVRSAMNGRRGVVIHAMGALDTALWDIKGKAAGVPCWKLLLDPGVR